METLLLTGDEVKELLSMEEVIKEVEVAFKEKGLKKVQMPSKIYIFYPKGDLRTMPSYLENLNISAVKVVNVHPDNPLKYNLPTVMATIILIDPENGFPLSIMDGTLITDFRTGAAGGIAAKYLARRESKILALVGAGRQAKTQLQALLCIYKKFEEVRVYSRTKERLEKFIKEVGTFYQDSIKGFDNLEKVVKGADIVVTTTPSKEPIVMNNWVNEGVHFNCIGADAPGKEELDPNILKRAKIVVDDWEQACHSGEINVPLSKGIIKEEDIYGELGEIVVGIKKGREKENEITIFTSTGLAIQDAVTAHMVYRKALRKGLGKFVKWI